MRRRPPLCSPAQLIGMTALLVYAFLTWQPWLMILVALGGTWWLATWLLAPHSRFAFRMRQPSAEDFERWRLRAERIKKVPGIGPIFRFGCRRSAGMEEKVASAYQRWIEDHSVENPHRPKG